MSVDEVHSLPPLHMETRNPGLKVLLVELLQLQLTSYDTSSGTAGLDGAEVDAAVAERRHIVL